MPSPDVAIVGGGVIGCSIAYHLAGAGARVAVFERSEVGGEASGAAAGMLAPLADASEGGPFFDLCLASLRLFPALAEALREETGIDIEYLPSGILRVATTEAEEAQLRAALGRETQSAWTWSGWTPRRCAAWSRACAPTRGGRSTPLRSIR